MLIKQIAQKDKPYVELVGADGNAYAIIGRVRSAWRSSDIEERENIIKEYTERATKGNYDDLLQITLEYINEGSEEEEEEEYKYVEWLDEEEE